MLMTRPKTEGISPFFIVSNVDQTIAFYRDKLGFETRFREPDLAPFFAIIGPTERKSSSNPTKMCRRFRTPSVIPP
jgi:catechol 2,3-dioxygenase-like lactoylglutathione lyase family enzyme